MIYHDIRSMYSLGDGHHHHFKSCGRFWLEHIFWSMNTICNVPLNEVYSKISPENVGLLVLVTVCRYIDSLVQGLRWLHCYRTGVTAVLHYAIDIFHIVLVTVIHGQCIPRIMLTFFFFFRVSIDWFCPIGTSVPWRIWIHRLREFTANCIPITKQSTAKHRNNCTKVITSLWILFPTIPIRDVKVIYKIVSNVWWNHLKCLYHSQHQYIICSSWFHLAFMSVFFVRFDRYWPKYVDIETLWCSLVAVAHIDNEWM